MSTIQDKRNNIQSGGLWSNLVVSSEMKTQRPGIIIFILLPRPGTDEDATQDTFISVGSSDE